MADGGGGQKGSVENRGVSSWPVQGAASSCTLGAHVQGAAGQRDCPLPSLTHYRHGKEALGRMYRILQGSLTIPEDVTPQCVLDALAAQGLKPGAYAYTRQREALMRVRVRWMHWRPGV